MIWTAPVRPELVYIEEWAEEFVRALGVPPGFHRITEPSVYFEKMSDPTRVLISGRTEADGRRWIHVSVSHPNRLPSWATMRAVKDIFLGKDCLALQLFPPESEWVNVHPYCLHLWRCLDDAGLPDFRVATKTGDKTI